MDARLVPRSCWPEPKYFLLHCSTCLQMFYWSESHDENGSQYGRGLNVDVSSRDQSSHKWPFLLVQAAMLKVPYIGWLCECLVFTAVGDWQSESKVPTWSGSRGKPSCWLLAADFSCLLTCIPIRERGSKLFAGVFL